MRTIVFYRAENGECPGEEFLDSLTGKQAQKVLWVLRLIEELDRVPSQYLKKLVNTDDLWEARAQLGNNIFRLLGFWEEAVVLVFNHGFAKKTQKTPAREIAVAEKRKQGYLARKGETRHE